MLGWAGLRGAVPVVLATFPVIEGVDERASFFNIVFFAVVISTLLQGTTFEPLAQRLGVTTSEPALPRPLAETGTIRRLGAEMLEYPVEPGRRARAAHRVRDLGLPRDALLSVIVRGEEAVLPRGSTRIEAGDRLHVVVRTEVAEYMEEVVSHWESGPVGPPPVEARPAVRIRGASARGRGTTRPTATPRIHRRSTASRCASTCARAATGAARWWCSPTDATRVTGPTLAVGGTRQVQAYARRRLTREADDTSRAWWQEVIGALAR